MIRVLLSVIGAYLLLVIIGASLFLFVVPIDAAKDIYAKIPAVMYKSAIRRAIVAGEIEIASALHADQADLAKKLGLNEAMKADLLEQSSEVVETLRNNKQYSTFLPWLERQAMLSPNNLSANLMLNEARIRSGANVESAELFRLRKILPTVDSIYRSAIEMGVRNGDARSVRDWCRLYHQAKLGGVDPRTFRSHRIVGQGLNSFMLELTNADGALVTNSSHGIQLNKRQIYKFEIHGAPPQKLLRLQLPFLPGVSVTVHSVQFVSRGQEKIFSPSQFYILPKTGFLIEDNTSLVTTLTGETLSLVPRKDHFPKSNVIRLELKFARLAIANGADCLRSNK